MKEHIKAKAGDLVEVGNSWCLVYRGRDDHLHNIILVDNYEPRSGAINGEELAQSKVVCHLSELLCEIKRAQDESE